MSIKKLFAFHICIMEKRIICKMRLCQVKCVIFLKFDFVSFSKKSKFDKLYRDYLEETYNIINFSFELIEKICNNILEFEK